MFGLILPMVAFYIFTDMFSHEAAQQGRWKVALLSLAATMVLFIASGAGLVIACILATLICLGGLIFWIRLTPLQAAKVTGSYVAFVFAYSVLVTLLSAPARAVQ
jgi:hypothetical protein